jgi:hypothetical protein
MTMLPKKRITDPTFVYRNSAETNIRATFARERRRLAAIKAAEEAQARAPVVPMTKRSAK